MADEQNIATAETSAAPKESGQQTPQAPTYSVDDFKRNSLGLFAVQPEVIDGALHGEKADQKYTVEDMKAKIKEFLEKPLTEKKDGDK